MSKYDDWKLRTPEEEEYDGECSHCGNPLDYNNTSGYCSKSCERYDCE